MIENVWNVETMIYRRKIIRVGIVLEILGILCICAVQFRRNENVWGNQQEEILETGSASSLTTKTENSDGDTEETNEEESAEENTEDGTSEAAEEKDYIRWVDFNVTSEAMERALQYDIDTYGTDNHIDWIVLLAYAGCRGGGEFGSKSLTYIDTAAASLKEGVSVEELTADMTYFNYYHEAYSAVLGGFVGEYQIEQEDENGQIVVRECYGVKAFSPIAKGFAYSDYDDFGSARSYGYSRPHLGHDMMGMIGTPIIAIESGYVEAIGWNQYGGWRIGIRSFDGKRYYYYAHLRQNYPYAEGLEEGSIVTAGDVIGYMGHTGYSTTENVNNIETVHLHWGLELIFDESQKDSNNEIWIDCYELTKFLSGRRSEACKVGETREWVRVHTMIDPAVEEFLLHR